MSLFDAIYDLAGEEDVTLNRLRGYVSVSGHSYPVFSAEEPITAVIRPWQAPEQRVEELGQINRDERFRVYVPDSHGLKRDDRINWRNGEFRLTDPEYSEHESMVRWMAKQDDRELRLAHEITEAHEIKLPDTGFGGY